MNTRTNIPNDIIREIISHVDPKDINTLYSCLLVNRTWCEHIIPLLWKEPFNIIKKNPRKLVTIYLNYFDDQTKFITRTVTYYKKTLFKYPSYLQKVSFMKIYDAVLDWVLFNNNEDKEIKKKEQNFSIMISKEMIKMFLNNSPLLEYLKIDMSRELSRRINYDSISFFSLNNHVNVLTKLNTLHFSNDNANNEIIEIVAQSSTSIKNIIITENDNWNNDNIVNTTINKLIKSQKEIERVIINEVSKGITEILSSLKYQKNTLKEIQFNNVSFGKDEHALKYISNFNENLKELRFRNCYNLTNNVMKELLNIEFPKLTSLEINNNDYFSYTENYPAKEILKLIENIGNNLSELILTLNTSSLSNSIFHHIQKYCYNLTTLGLDIGYSQLVLLFKLFKSLNKLERFIVQSDGRSIYIDNWLEEIPQSITSFEVNGWIISPKGLKDFLKVTRNKINVLSWRLPTNLKFDDYSAIIDEYTNKNDLYFIKDLRNHHQKDQNWDEIRIGFI